MHATRLRDRFLRAARDARRTQARVLNSLVQRHATSDFGRRYRLASVRHHADFVSHVPIQGYEDLRPYVDRIAAGEYHALLGRGLRPLMLAMTSGSVDRPKYVPVTREFLRDYRRGWNIFGVSALLDHPDAWLRGILQVSSPMDVARSASGLPCGAISGLLASAQKRLVRKCYVCPSIVGRISDHEARYYTVMRLSLPCDVAWMITASPATHLALAATGVRYAPELIRDIHDGTLNPPGDMPAGVRTALCHHLRPDPSTAIRLEETAHRYGELLPKHYWRLALLSNWTGGSMKLHLDQFPKYFGDTPVRDIGLLATEGRVTLPFEDASPAGILDVQSSYFEFVEGDAPITISTPTLQCHELTVDRVYRVIMSTSAGFFRYDLGDYVRVRGFYAETPLLEFLHRGAFVSSMTGEKLTEWQAVTAFERACAAFGVARNLFVLAPVWGDPPYYRLHFEQPVARIQEMERQVDEELARLNIEYAAKRSSQRLGPVSINALAAGTLRRRDIERSAARGVANEQFKHRYLLSIPGEDAELMKPLNQAAIGSNTCEKSAV